jgi:hypothetical protein
VRQGDKRIILIDGEAVGAINRVPAAGEARSNMHVGGRPEKSSLTPRDRQICDTIGPVLRERGMIFVGIDVIGNYLTEINVTSPPACRRSTASTRSCWKTASGMRSRSGSAQVIHSTFGRRAFSAQRVTRPAASAAIISILKRIDSRPPIASSSCWLL